MSKDKMRKQIIYSKDKKMFFLKRQKRPKSERGKKERKTREATITEIGNEAETKDN